MEYKDFKDGQKVMVYIPVLQHFYNAVLVETVRNDFTVAFTGPIKGHYDQIKRIENQEQLDKWFFVTKRQKITDALLAKGLEVFNRNGKGWIF